MKISPHRASIMKRWKSNGSAFKRFSKWQMLCSRKRKVCESCVIFWWPQYWKLLQMISSSRTCKSFWQPLNSTHFSNLIKISRKTHLKSSSFYVNYLFRGTSAKAGKKHGNLKQLKLTYSSKKKVPKFTHLFSLNTQILTR